jgi:hypothetical protein
MFYALTPPESVTDRVRLYPTARAALAQACEDRTVFVVAVDLDAGGRLVVPRWVDPQAIAPDWATCAQLHGDGSITARGRIPQELFVGCLWARR